MRGRFQSAAKANVDHVQGSRCKKNLFVGKYEVLLAEGPHVTFLIEITICFEIVHLLFTTTN